MSFSLEFLRPHKIIKNQTWLLVKQINQNNYHKSIQKGLILQFDRDRYHISKPLENTSISKKYVIEDDNITLDTSLFGKIIHLSADSLVIQQDIWRMTFFPLEETSLNTMDQARIILGLGEAIWETYVDSTMYRFYCDTSKWGLRYENMDWIKTIMYSEHYKNDSSEYSHPNTSEWWTLKYFDNKVLFIYSTGQFEPNFIQITSIDGDKMSGRTSYLYNENWQNIKLIKAKTPEKLASISKEALIGSWSATILNKSKDGKTRYPASSNHEDYDEIIVNPKTGKPLSQTELEARELVVDYASEIFHKVPKFGRASITDLKANNLSYHFYENGKYEIKAGQRVIRRGDHWDFTKDKRYLYLDNAFNTENYIKLKSYNGKALILEKGEFIDAEQEKRWMCFFTK